MKYNITVYLNKITKDVSADFEKAKAYYAKHGVDISFTFTKSNVKGYTSVWSGSRWFINGTHLLVPQVGDMTLFVFNQNEWAAPKGSKYPLLGNTPTGNCYIFNGKPFINVGYFEGNQKTGLFFLEIIHEIMHALVYAARLSGIQVQDIMDTYYKNNISQYLDADSNFSKQLQLLQPYLSKPQKPTVTIKREYTKDATLGSLIATNGGATFICKSLELPWRDNKPNVSCVPVGTYEVIWSLSPRKMKYTYRLVNVKGRSGILFHSVNYVKDLQGCIGLGNAFKDINGDKVLDIINSRITMNAFEGFMGKKPFTLTIT